MVTRETTTTKKSTKQVVRPKANTNVVAVSLGSLAADLDHQADAKSERK